MIPRIVEAGAAFNEGATRRFAGGERQPGREIGDLECQVLGGGCHADFVVLDQQAAPLTAMKQDHTGTLAETLFNLMILGDDRAVAATWGAAPRRMLSAA